jgi:hypothetical protein
MPSVPEQGSEADESWRWRRDSNPRVTDLQSATKRPGILTQQAFDGDEACGLGSCLALLPHEFAALSEIVDAWPRLPEPAKAAVLVLCRGS